MAEITVKMNTDNSKHHIDMHVSGTGFETSMMIANIICNQSKTNGFPYQMLLDYIETLCEQLNNDEI